jgi:phage portal protein BeeE
MSLTVCRKPRRPPLGSRPRATLYDMLRRPAALPNAAGVKVTRGGRSATRPSGAAVNLIAGDVGRLPVRVMRRAGKGKDPRRTNTRPGVLRRPNDT